MTRIALVTNSFAALPPDLVERYNITLVPMQIQFLTDTYEEDHIPNLAEFYQRLANEEVVPTTAPPPIQRYLRVFQDLAANYDTILSIHVSATLSDSYERAQQAARQVVGAQVEVFDSGTLAFGIGVQVLTAARLIERGATLPTILEALRWQRAHTLVLFTPATLRFLRNSRRVGPLAVLMASWLNIKPIVRLSQGRVDMIDRPRSWDAALDRQCAELDHFLAGATPSELGVCHANDPAIAQRLATRLQERFPHARLYVFDVGAVVAVHVGPGALGLITYLPGPHDHDPVPQD